HNLNSTTAPGIEVNGDRVGPGGVGRGEAQLDVMPTGQGPDRGGLVRRQVVEDDVDRLVVGSGRPDALERGEGVLAALVQPGDPPQPVLGEVIAAVEVADPVSAVVGGGQPVGMLAGRPAGAVAGSDAQGSELVEREAPVKPFRQDLFDPVQLGVVLRIRGGLPGPGPLKTRSDGRAAADAAVRGRAGPRLPNCRPDSRPACANSSA